MIEVTVLETGDNAAAETTEDAVFAAITIATEARKARATQGFNPTIRFDVNGEPARITTLRELTR